MIARKVHFYWANNRMSWLRYMTLLSFRKMNPKWEINLHLAIPNSINTKTWRGTETQDFFNFSGRDFFSEMHNIDINIRQVGPLMYNGVSWEEHVAPSTKSDFFRWSILYEEGGFYSDIDILFVKPIDSFYFMCSASDSVMCYGNGYWSAGFIGSSAGNLMYRDLLEFAFENFNAGDYQTAGPTALASFVERKRLNKEQSPIDIIRTSYPKIKNFNMVMENVYPWAFSQVKEIWNENHDSVPNECFGIHWFAGDPLSQQYNNILTAENMLEHSNTFTTFAKKLWQ